MKTKAGKLQQSSEPSFAKKAFQISLISLSPVILVRRRNTSWKVCLNSNFGITEPMNPDTYRLSWYLLFFFNHFKKYSNVQLIVFCNSNSLSVAHKGCFPNHDNSNLTKITPKSLISRSACFFFQCFQPRPVVFISRQEMIRFNKSYFGIPFVKLKSMLNISQHYNREIHTQIWNFAVDLILIYYH